MVSASSRRRAVLVDRHPLWLDAVRRVLDEVGIESVAAYTSPSQALEEVKAERPQLLVVEPEANDGALDGLTCVRRSLEACESLKAVAFSGLSDAAQISAAFAAGAAAYVVKTARPDDIAAAIRQAFDHSIYFAYAPSPADLAADDDAGAALTRREREILTLVAEGHSNVHLARMLWVTEQTVKFHLSNIYRKLDVANRTEASRWAQLHGLLNETSARSGLRDTVAAS